MEEKKSDEGKHVFQHLIRVTFYYSSANSSLALTHAMESETAFYKKDSYDHYLSYDTLVSTFAIPVSVETYFRRIWAENEADCPQIT